MSSSNLNTKPQDDTFAAGQDLEEAMDEHMDVIGGSIPPIAELAKVAEEAQKAVAYAEMLEGEQMGDRSNDPELEELLSPEVTPTITQGTTKASGKARLATPTRVTSQVVKPAVEEVPESGDIDYAESFASQQETAQLREDFEGLFSKVTSLEDTITVMMKERENLPHHLTTIKEDINSQMTIILDRLNSALESESSPLNVKAAVTAVEGVKDVTDDRLKAAVSYTADAPRKSSPLTSKDTDLKGKRRFRPIK